ncbi:MAG: HEAT repeat domain-containing protein [Gemmataceae bacterium]
MVEAAEALGSLGAPEAGPVLTGLLRHPSDHVRQTVAQALERTADAGLIDGLLRGLDDPGETVRFSLLGALSRAAGAGQPIPVETRKRLVERLEGLLKRDADPGVRSRAATVLGECGTADELPMLWQQVLTSTEGRVQEKAWEAFVEVLVRAGSVPLVERWERTLIEAKQGARRVALWTRVQARWELQPATREQAGRAVEGLVQAQLDAGKWAAAAPLVLILLARTVDATEAQRSRWLRWVAQVGELALAEGNRAEAVRVLQEARPYLPKSHPLAERFDALEKQAGAAKPQ